MRAHSDFATCCSISQGYYFTGRVNMMPMTLFTQWLETLFFFSNVSESQGFNFARKKIITWTTWSWKERKWHSIFMRAFSFSLEIHWSVKLHFASSGSWLHSWSNQFLAAWKPPPHRPPAWLSFPQPRGGCTIALLKCWITTWKLPLRVPLIGQASCCWKHSCCVISQVLTVWVALLQKSLT